MFRLFEPGEQIERWLVLDRILGGWGVVYVVRDLDHDGQMARPAVLAVKTLRPEMARDERVVKHFAEEAYVWLNLGIHKHIVRLYTVDRVQGQLCALAEYIPDGIFPNTVRGWLENTLIDPEIGLRFGVHLCRALSFAHSRGVMAHQDLTPENLMVTEQGVLKVTDWGLSRLERRTREAIATVAAMPFSAAYDDSIQALAHGTSDYLAPELSRETSVSHCAACAADMFSLGVILSEMLGGRRLAADVPLSEIERLLVCAGLVDASSVARIVLRCLSSKPEERPQSPDEVEVVLSDTFHALVGIPIENPPPREWETLADRGQRAYGLFMLGRNDEAMKIQMDVMASVRDTTAQSDSDQKVSSPLVLMDHKEHGWTPIVPAEHLRAAREDLEMKPGDCMALENAINVNYLAGEFEATLGLCTRYLALKPDDIDKLKLSANLLGKAGRWREGLKQLDRVVVLSAEAAHAWLDRAEYCFSHGDTNEAMVSIRNAIAANPKHAKSQATYGHYLSMTGDHEGAVAAFTQAVLLEPDEALHWYNLGTTFNKLGRLDPAFKALLRAVEKDPSFARAFNSLGGLAGQMGLAQEAVVFFEKAIQADPHYARPWLNKGGILEHLGKPREAWNAYTRALEIDPDYELAKKAIANLESERLV